MATDAMCSNMASSVTVQGFQMAYLTLSTHFLQSFLQIWGAPRAPTADEAKVAEVHLVETTKDLVEGTIAEE